MEPVVSSNYYFPALTGVRALAAFSVFFFHFNPFDKKSFLPMSAIARLFSLFLAQGHVGVTMFFVLSGFLITIRYQSRIKPTWGWTRQYLLNRFARIYPLYFLLTVCAFVAMLGHLLTWYTWPEHASTAEILFATVADFTLLRGFFRSYYLLGVPAGWSLTVEACFYLLAPLLLLGLRQRISWLPVVAIGLLAIGGGLALVAPRIHWYGYFMQPFSFVLAYTYFGRTVEFLVGMGLAFWLERRGTAPARRGTTLLGIVFIIACVIGMIAGNENYRPTEAWPTPMIPILINNFLLPLGIAMLFHGLVNEQTWFRRILETKVFDLLGKSSYAFYLVHIGLFSDLLGKTIGQNSFVYFGIFNVVAILLYKMVEHPLHIYVLKQFSR